MSRTALAGLIAALQLGCIGAYLTIGHPAAAAPETITLEDLRQSGEIDPDLAREALPDLAAEAEGGGAFFDNAMLLADEADSLGLIHTEIEFLRTALEAAPTSSDAAAVAMRLAARFAERGQALDARILLETWGGQATPDERTAGWLALARATLDPADRSSLLASALRESQTDSRGWLEARVAMIGAGSATESERDASLHLLRAECETPCLPEQDLIIATSILDHRVLVSPSVHWEALSLAASTCSNPDIEKEVRLRFMDAMLQKSHAPTIAANLFMSYVRANGDNVEALRELRFAERMLAVGESGKALTSYYRLIGRFSGDSMAFLHTALRLAWMSEGTTRDGILLQAHDAASSTGDFRAKLHYSIMCHRLGFAVDNVIASDGFASGFAAAERCVDPLHAQAIVFQLACASSWLANGEMLAACMDATVSLAAQSSSLASDYYVLEVGRMGIAEAQSRGDAASALAFAERLASHLSATATVPADILVLLGGIE